MTEDRRIEPPPHLLKEWVQAAREAGKKGGPYAKTFAMAAIDWALNSQSTPNNLQIRSSEIAPPPELVEQWVEYAGLVGINEHQLVHLATQAARWGSDQELEAICTWLEPNYPHVYTTRLRRCRRPEPPSLKAQALQAAQRFYANGHEDCSEEEVKDDFDIIRRALESLPN